MLKVTKADPGAAGPLIYELPYTADDALRALLSLAPQRRVSILDSCGARAGTGRLLIAGFDPRETIEARGEEIRLTQSGERAGRIFRGDALRLLDERLAVSAGGVCVA